jgi:DNA-binding transcriptional ArsR family regulator
MDDRAGSSQDLPGSIALGGAGGEEAAPTLAEIFAALGDPNRQRMVEMLANRGSTTASRLAEPLQVTRQGAEKHLGVLARAGLVTSQRKGREVLYALRTEEFAGPSAWLNRIAANWERRLEAIKRLAEE